MKAILDGIEWKGDGKRKEQGYIIYLCTLCTHHRACLKLKSYSLQAAWEAVSNQNEWEEVVTKCKLTVSHQEPDAGI